MRVDRETTEGSMNRIADRIAAALESAGGCALGVVFVGCLGVAGGQAYAQPPASTPATPTKPATFSGCVQKAPGSSTELVISAPTACAKLTGNVPVDNLAGHQVDLTGILTPRTTSAPASIAVDSVKTVGASCTDVCSLRPPGTRGSASAAEQRDSGHRGRNSGCGCAA
jgi:hypothetical protein